MVSVAVVVQGDCFLEWFLKWTQAAYVLCAFVLDGGIVISSRIGFARMRGWTMVFGMVSFTICVLEAWCWHV